MASFMDIWAWIFGVKKEKIEPAYVSTYESAKKELESLDVKLTDIKNNNLRYKKPNYVGKVAEKFKNTRKEVLRIFYKLPKGTVVRKKTGALIKQYKKTLSKLDELKEHYHIS